jgi:lactate permease
VFYQNYNPLGDAFLSTAVAALPILVFLYFLALHPHRDRNLRLRFGTSAPLAALIAWLTALAISVKVLRMPVPAALSAFAYGMLSGLVGIIWIVVAAMFLYTMTLITGKFEIVKQSITRISSDRRLLSSCIVSGTWTCWRADWRKRMWSLMRHWSANSNNGCGCAMARRFKATWQRSR